MSGLSGSFSGIHSLVEGSEAISEADEIQEVKHLQKRGDKAFHGQNFSEALRCYNDALEIDEKNTGALASRAAVFIEMNNYILAQQDSEKLLSFSPRQAQGHYLLGVSLDNLGQYRESLTAFLNALDLDTDPNHADILASNIASTAQHFCTFPENLLENLTEMDPYNKLCEVGACLYQAGRNEQCIKVLNAAQKVATNQKGITMKVQLTLANAHSALKHTDIAISLYQECLSTALSTHDYQYQTKALVNIASLFLEIGDTHRAIVHYEKLLALEKQIKGESEDSTLPAYWTNDLRCALHLNLSIAYKTIGSLEYAVHFARIYTQLVGQEESTPNVQAQSFHNQGLLHQILGEYTEAVDSYTNYLKLSKKAGDRRGVAMAYGCLGSVYAALRNYHLSVTYHEQHVAVATKLGDPRLIGIAHEQFGDSRFVFEEFTEAVDCYMAAIRSGPRNDLRMQTSALSKIGKAYKSLKRYQYSLYYFEQSKIIAEDFEFDDLKVACEYNLACILQNSTQMFEIDHAEKFFNRLIPIFEAQIYKHREEDSFCPQELHNQLDDCYLGIINIYAKSGNRDDALVYSEAQRKKPAVLLAQNNIYRSQSVLSLTSIGQSGTFDTWSISKLMRVVADQNTTVVYYTLLSNFLAVWVLSPGEGVARFYTSKPNISSSETMGENIKKQLQQLLKTRNTKELVYDCENRALPERDCDTKLIKNANRKLRSSNDGEGNTTLTSSENPSSEGGSNMSINAPVSDKDSHSNTKGPDRKLFDLLLAPIYDILSKLEPGSPVTVIPHKELLDCPFGIIRDWNQMLLKDRFRITVIPSLFLLEKVMQNEMNQLRLEDNIEFLRGKSQLGGVARLASSMEPDARKTPAFDFSSRLHGTETDYSAPGPEPLDTRRTSNPRFAKSNTMMSSISKKTWPHTVPHASRASKVSMSMSTSKTKSNPVPPVPKTIPLHSVKAVGSPTKVDKMMSVHTMSTLTTKTSTNTDIVKAGCGVSEFKQVSDPERCLVTGSPTLPDSLHLYGQEWHPRRNMSASQKECFKVAELLGLHAVVGESATKDSFLKDVQEATVVHIATLANLEEGLLVMCPNSKRHEEGAPLERSYIVTASEVADLCLVAKLVVLSCGWCTSARESSPESLYYLPTAFLAAGAQCVVTLLWAVPNAALDKFYYHFYQALQDGGHVTTAVTIAGNFLKAENRYEDYSYWAPFIIIGKDIEMDLQQVRHAMLDQLIDEVEKEVAEELDEPPLNPKARIPDVASLEENLADLQKYLGELLLQHNHQNDVVPELIELLDGALKRLHMEENNRRTVRLAPCIAHTEAGLKLLKLLGFHFQGKGSSLIDPYVIYPHWNPDNLLVPTYDALRAAIDITLSPTFTRSLFEFLPGPQDMISYIIDVICISKHAPEIQLKVTDMSVRPLWKNTKVKAILTSMGFQQVGPLLTFAMTPTSARIMNASLQFLIAISAHKSTTLQHKLDVTLLGGPNSATCKFPIYKELLDDFSVQSQHIDLEMCVTSDIQFDRVKLPSLHPVILPRNQLRVATPWLSAIETGSEMDEKMRLAQSKADLATEYRESHQRAKTWHQLTLSTQAKEALDQFGQPKPALSKVKVKPGATASCQRLPIEHKLRLNIPDTDQRRDYANFVLSQRLENISLRHKNDTRKAYLPYVDKPCPSY